MKPNLLASFALVALWPVTVLANGAAGPAVPIDVSAASSASPPTGSNTKRMSVSLREALRQPPQGMDHQPFRLSAQERARLRQQLSLQPIPATPPPRP